MAFWEWFVEIAGFEALISGSVRVSKVKDGRDSL